MTAKQRAQEALRRLSLLFPDARCELQYHNAFELFVAVQLSAQCTDARVNSVTPALFAQLKNWDDLAFFPREKLETLIFSTGFYRQKAKNLQLAAQKIITHFGGELPKSLSELTTLAGVGRKTAHVLLQNLFGIVEGIVVDTHVLRLARRLGLTHSSYPDQVEKDLMKHIPRKDWALVGNLFVWYGRKKEPARSQGIFPLSDLYPQKISKGVQEMKTKNFLLKKSQKSS